MSTIGDAKYLKKRIPENPRYKHIKTRVDTGCSQTKYLERLEEIQKNYRYRKGELFKRLKVTTFAQLVLQVAYVTELNESVNDDESPRQEEYLLEEVDAECLSEQTNGWPPGDSCHTARSTSQSSREAEDSCHTARSTLQSVISGVGELDLGRNGEKSSSVTPVSSPLPDNSPYTDCPYLLLDVRDRDQYDQCHVITAHSFPITTLSRTMNPYSKEVLTYKNTAGKIIIVYDEDEMIASQAGTIMCERGFENLYMLSGGLKVIAQKCPEGMTTGSFPASCLPSTAEAGRRRPAPRPPQQVLQAERRWRFTADELSKVQQQLDEQSLASDADSRMSSRLSTSSGQSKASSARSSRQSTARKESGRAQSSRAWK